MSYEYIDSWKNESVFIQQLKLNMNQFQNGWPTHWSHFIEQVNLLNTKIDRIIDVGCGCGSYALLTKNELKNVEYVGYDYSCEAIKVAKECFGEIGKFEQKSYQEMTKEDIEDGDLIVINGLIDILPDGNKCLEHILCLDPKIVSIQRIPITYEKNYYEIYDTPYGINTYKFYYNKRELVETIKSNGYTVFKWDSFNEDSVDVTMVKQKGQVGTSDGCCK